MRTHLCGEVTEKLDGQAVELCGWVDARRDLGGLIFIGLRDRAGIVQVVVEPDSPAFADAETLRKEYCVKITGTVRLRPESQWNENMATGKVEVIASAVEVLNASAPIPLMMSDEDGEEIRLKGGGWYETDFKKGGKKNVADSGKSEAPGCSTGACPASKNATSSSTA